MECKLIKKENKNEQVHLPVHCPHVVCSAFVAISFLLYPVSFYPEDISMCYGPLQLLDKKTKVFSVSPGEVFAVEEIIKVMQFDWQ